MIPLHLLGQYQNMRIIDPEVSLIHFIIWKFTLIALTQLTKDVSPFVVDKIIIRKEYVKVHVVNWSSTDLYRVASNVFVFRCVFVQRRVSGLVHKHDIV